MVEDKYKMLGLAIIDTIYKWHKDQGIPFADPHSQEQIRETLKLVQNTQPTREKIDELTEALLEGEELEEL